MAAWTWPRPRSSVSRPRAPGPRIRRPRRRRPLNSFQRDARDLRRGPEPHGRTPVAGAAGDIEVRLAVLEQAGDIGLLEPHHVHPRPDLPAVGVPAQLKIHAVA